MMASNVFVITASTSDKGIIFLIGNFPGYLSQRPRNQNLETQKDQYRAAGAIDQQDYIKLEHQYGAHNCEPLDVVLSRICINFCRPAADSSAPLTSAGFCCGSESQPRHLF